MPLNKTKGNMYPWVTHTHTHLGGKCVHDCKYCYVQNSRFGTPPRYQGALRLIEEELKVPYGSGKVIFLEHMNDLFAWEVPDEWIARIMAHVHAWPKNTYVFQTKNPDRLIVNAIPSGSIVGVTIETNRSTEIALISNAPPPYARISGMSNIPSDVKKFITIEPIIDFDVDILSSWILHVMPDFINIGADSKHCGLHEPPASKILELVENINRMGIEIREKHNLSRIIGHVK